VHLNPCQFRVKYVKKKVKYVFNFTKSRIFKFISYRILMVILIIYNIVVL